MERSVTNLPHCGNTPDGVGSARLPTPVPDSAMAWIRTVPDEQWADDADLAGLHPAVVDPEHGPVDHIMAAHSLNPRGLAAHQALYTSAMAGTKTFRKVDRELVALVVSLQNDCHY